MEKKDDIEERQKEKKKCPKCGGELELVVSCCKMFWYCKNCDEIIGDIENRH